MTLVIAHRGASAYEVENSLTAFHRAVALGADGIELDVHGTADAELIVHHDDTLSGRRLAGLPLDVVRTHRLTNGEPIPTLVEALSAIGGRTIVFVEVKALPPEMDQRLFECLDGGPAPGRYHVHSFDHRIIHRLCTRRRDRTYGVLSSSYPCHPLVPVTDAGATELWQHESLIDRDLVSAAHAAGTRVYAWTVDDPARMTELRDLGIDGICSNRPDVVRRVLS